MNPTRSKSPEIPPHLSVRERYEEKIRASAKKRDIATEKLWGQLLVSSITPRQFLNMALAKFNMPQLQTEENMASALCRLQLDVLDFSMVDAAYDKEGRGGADGKGGPVTFDKIIELVPGFKKYSREYHIDQREKFAAQEGLPSRERHAGSRETGPLKSGGRILHIGDSHSEEMGYEKSSFVKRSRSVVTMWKMVRDNRHLLSKYDGFTLQGGANNLGYMSGAKIYQYLEQITSVILHENPNALIKIVEIPPSKGWKGFKTAKQKELVGQRVVEANRRLARLERLFPNNIKIIKIYDALNDPQSPGYMKGSGDGLHANAESYRAMAAMIKEDFKTGKHNSMEEYIVRRPARKQVRSRKRRV